MHVDHIDASANPYKHNGARQAIDKFCGWDSGLGDALKRLRRGEDITRDFQLLCAWDHAIKTYEERRRERMGSQLEFVLPLGPLQMELSAQPRACHARWEQADLFEDED